MFSFWFRFSAGLVPACPSNHFDLALMVAFSRAIVIQGDATWSSWVPQEFYEDSDDESHDLNIPVLTDLRTVSIVVESELKKLQHRIVCLCVCFISFPFAHTYGVQWCVYIYIINYNYIIIYIVYTHN